MTVDLADLRAQIAAIPDGGHLLMSKADLVEIERNLRAGNVAMGAVGASVGIARLQEGLLNG